MHARVATFAVDDRDKIDGEIATTREITADGPPDGIPAKEFLMLIDRDGGRVVEVMIFETEDDLRKGNETLNSMSPGPARSVASPWRRSKCRCTRPPECGRARQGSSVDRNPSPTV
jgi:hypothetical protein